MRNESEICMTIGMHQKLDMVEAMSSVSDKDQSEIGIIQKCQDRNDKRKRVRFSNATVRVYGVTVGALSAARDSCPIQLTWKYTEDQITQLEDKIRSNQAVYCRKLTLLERRTRIAAVQGLAIQKIKELELQTVLDQIRSSTDFYEKLLSTINFEPTGRGKLCGEDKQLLTNNFERRDKLLIDNKDKNRSVSRAA